jgi:hypothetical protein
MRLFGQQAVSCLRHRKLNEFKVGNRE